MNKEDLTSVIVYTLMIVFAAIIGFGVLTPVFSKINNINGMNIRLFLVIALVISIIGEAIIFELGHVFGAKLGKYEVLSICVYGFCLYKSFSEGKYSWKFKFSSSYDGLSGETKVSPLSEDADPRKYSFGPFFVFLFQIILMVLFYVLIKNPSKTQNPLNWLKYFQIVLVSVGGLLFVYNYFPAKLDSTTDGYRILSLGKEVNKRAFNVLSKEEGDEFKGIGVDKYQYFDEITDFTAQANLKVINQLLLRDDIKLAGEYIEKLVNSEAKISINTEYKIKLTKLFYLIFSSSKEEAIKYYDSFNDSTKYYLKNEYTMLSIRTALLYFGIIEKSESECENQRKHIKKALEKENTKNQEIETLLMKKVENILK